MTIDLGWATGRHASSSTPLRSTKAVSRSSSPVLRAWHVSLPISSLAGWLAGWAQLVENRLQCSGQSDHRRAELSRNGAGGERRTLFYKYQPYGTSTEKLQEGRYTIRYDLSLPSITDAQRRILAWPDQWAEFGLGEYGPGVSAEAAKAAEDGMFTAARL